MKQIERVIINRRCIYTINNFATKKANLTENRSFLLTVLPVSQNLLPILHVAKSKFFVWLAKTNYIPCLPPGK